MTIVRTRPWPDAIRNSADPKRAKHFFDLLTATSAGKDLQQFSAQQAGVVAALLSGSQALGTLLVAHPEWLRLIELEGLTFRRQKQGLEREVDSWLVPLVNARDYNAALKQLRLFKQNEMLRIAARDLARLADVTEIIHELSDVADVCLAAVWKVCYQRLVERHGEPWHRQADGTGSPTTACLLGLGKLGGQELNYSSDVDVMFVYAEEGTTESPKSKVQSPKSGEKSPKSKVQSPKPSGGASLTNHQFFNRLAEAVVGEVSSMAPEGMLFRIDLRLRPEGDAGPLSRSLAGCENYYAQWGQTWERMMLIKARGVAGDEGLAHEFLEMVQSFRYPQQINEGVLREVAQMKERIENEVVKSGEIERNVKLGRGGIREIEFVAQMLQLLHAGRQPFLQTSHTLPALEKLVQYELLSAKDKESLAGAYTFLRELEHRLQMDANLQTHTIPEERSAQERLARLMGFASLSEFERAHTSHRREVRKIFEKVLTAEVPQKARRWPFPPQFEGFEEPWRKWLSAFRFRDVEKALRVLREFVEGPGYVHVSPRTKELAYELLPRLFELCPKMTPERGAMGQVKNEKSRIKNDSPERILSDPDRVVTRLDSFIGAYGARATLFELWNSNPAIFELLLLLFDRSEFLAELTIRDPGLVDDLVTSGRLRQRKAADETLADLRYGANDADQYLWLRRYHQAELMRIGLRDILGLATFEEYLTELSALADACLQYALECVMRRHRLKRPPFVVIGLGKLGGAEIDYGSDLDIIFVTETKKQDLAKLGRLALEVTELLSRRTEQGLVFHTDARLRPDGEKGLLVNTLKAFETYYCQRARLWEIQSLTRTRVIAGDMSLGNEFQNLTARLTNFSAPLPGLAAYSNNWVEEIHRMRMRIEKERTPAGKDALAIKTGKGGLMDAEFIAQKMCLEHGWQEANTLRALQRGQASGKLPNAGKLIEDYRHVRRVEGILRRWSYEGEIVLPDDPAPYYRVSVRCGFRNPEDFRQAIVDWRRGIRESYLKVFGLSERL